MVFKRFIKRLVDFDDIAEVKQNKNLAKKIIGAPNTDYSISIIGIANSVELFKGELSTSTQTIKGNLLQSNQLLSKNEVKLLFEPYTREDL